MNLTSPLQQVDLRPAFPSDVPVLTRLERQAPSAAHWSDAQYAGIFDNDAPHRHLLIAQARASKTSNPEPVGFAIALAASSDWEIENIVVDESFRHLGVGTLLLEAMELTE